MAALVTAMVSLSGTPASAGDLVYKPVNPSFGGNPINTNHLIGLADRQNRFEQDRRTSPRTPTSAVDQFVRNLQSRMLVSLAQEVNEAIFGEDARESGTIVFGDQVIAFERGLEAVHMTIEDASMGTRTEISIPLLQVQ